MTYYCSGKMTLYLCPVCGRGLLADGEEDLSRFAVDIRCVEWIDWNNLTYRDVDNP
jgi:hypothetical protein